MACRAIFTLIYVILGRQLLLQGGAALASGGRPPHRGRRRRITEGYAVGRRDVVGQWRGAGNNERAAESAFQASRYGALSMVPLSLLAVRFAPQLPSCAGPRGVASRRQLPEGRGVVLPLLRRRGVFDGGCIGRSARFIDGARCVGEWVADYPRGFIRPDMASTASGGPSCCPPY